MLSPVHIDIARMRYTDLLAEAARDRLADEAMRSLRANVGSQSRPQLTLSWHSRWIRSDLRQPARARE